MAALSLAAVAVPLAEMSEAIGASDVAYVAAVFAAILLTELAVLRIVSGGTVLGRFTGRLSALLLVAALVLNVGSFYAPLINARLAYLVALPVVAGLVLWLAIPSAAARRGLVVFALLMSAISLGKAAYSRAATAVPESRDVRIDAAPAQPTGFRNVYVLSFDALVSREAMRVLYASEVHPTADVLEKLGFRVSDTLSAGDDTVRTFGRMMSLGEEFNHTVARTFFNGLRPVPLYRRLRGEGYRIQFVYATEYFGVDAGRIDYFYPDTASPFICEFVDSRYALFACRQWFRETLERWIGLKVVSRSGAEQNDEAEFERILDRFRHAAASRSDPWFSIAYLWYPGHTPLNLRYDDANGVATYRRTMLGRLPRLNAYIERIVEEIRTRDPGGMIVMFGDHGAWLLRGAEAGDVFDGRQVTQALLALDRRSVLLAVYHDSLCAERMAAVPDTRDLFPILLDCLQRAPAPSR